MGFHYLCAGLGLIFFLLGVGDVGDMFEELQY